MSHRIRKTSCSLRALGVLGPMPRGRAPMSRKRKLAQAGVTKALVELRYFAARYDVDFASASRYSCQLARGGKA